jgi:O-antigen/teichoic acid export membrane protein
MRDDHFTFAKDIIWVTISQIVISLLLGIFTLPILTKNYSPDIFGVWIQVNVAVDLLSPILSLQLGLAAVRFLASENDIDKRRRSLGAMLLMIVVFSFFVSLVGLIFTKQLSVFLFGSVDYVNYIYAILIWSLVNSLFNFFLSYLQARSKNKSFAIVQFSITCLRVLFIFVLATVGSGMFSIVLSQIILQTFFCLVLFVLITKEEGTPILALTNARYLLFYSLPQIPNILLLWIIKSSDRLFLTHFKDLTQAGVYSSSLTLANLGYLFYYPVSFVLFSLTARLWAQNRVQDIQTYFNYSFKFFLGTAIPGVIGISFLSQRLLTLLTTSDYLIGKYVVLLVTLGIIFFGIYQINTNLILLVKRSKYLPLVVGSAVVVNIVMNVILVPKFGALGAAISNCVAYLVSAVISTVWSQKIVRYRFDLTFYVKVVGASLLMLGCLQFINIDTYFGIGVAILVGTVVYGLGLFLLRAFSNQDIQMARTMLRNLFPKFMQK